ncbi:MAG: flagellar hook capping FlgD N-terminal domain-containing protein [Mariprofundaceae bacterium]
MLLPTIDQFHQQADAAKEENRTNVGNKDIFLKLLTAQMSNQDPLNPSDATQMSSQLAQFNMVEQQLESNDTLKAMLENQTAMANAQNALAEAVSNQATGSGADSGVAASYLGHTVLVAQDRIQHDGASPARMQIDMLQSASDVTVTIRDAQGLPIRQMVIGAVPAGPNSLSWDGLDDNGVAAPAGEYQFDVNAVDAQSGTVDFVLQRLGLVEAVRLTQGGYELVVGGIPATMNDITEIRL